MARWARWWPLTGIAFVALWIIGFAILGDDVDSQSSNEKILAYYAKSGNRDKHVALFFMVLAAGLFFVWFITRLRGRLARAEGTAGNLTAVVVGAGMTANALWLVSSALFVAPAFSIEDTKKFTLDPDTYRISQDIGYAIWFSGTTIAAILVAATTVLALRHGLLPKVICWLSFVVAATMLVSFFFIPFIIMCGWILVVCATLILRPEPQAPAPQT